ncbi:MAG: hypothetical protein Q4A18_02830, partial [Rikenellaceae bacterium]|nr:hypothetical protein [Rikenellaceae bacterium]
MLMSAWLMVGCAIYSSEDELVEPNKDNTSDKVTLNLNVAVTDGAAFLGQSTRADYSEAVSDGEKMQTLRLIIVRPDGTVEHNRYYDFHQAPSTTFTSAKFEVVGGETKNVYLFANENTTFSTNHKVFDYDFEALEAGDQFPAEELAAVTINLSDNQTCLPLPLFMSEQHEVVVPAKQDTHVELIIVRAATKFTFRLINNSALPLLLSKLTIEKLARAEYMLPNGVVYGFENNVQYIESYNVPMVGNNEHYEFVSNFADIEIPASNSSSPLILDPFYLLESKYDDTPDEDKRNYKISLTADGHTYTDGFFDNLE